MSESWSAKKVTILGLGRSGSSAAAYLLKRGAAVLVSEFSPIDDARAQQVNDLKALGASVESGGHSHQAIESADLIVISPGIPPGSAVVQKAQALGKEVISDIELAYRESGNVKIIGITGTNGKSTTCALTSHMLETAGFTAPACGNFGVPILDRLEASPDFLVAEVSSYQLHYCPTFAPYIGVWLNLTPDHLEWHGGLDAYIAAKKKMFLQQRRDQFAILNDDDFIVANFQPPSEIFPFSVEQSEQSSVQAAFMDGDFLCYRIHGATRIVCHKSDLKIIGKHNLENVLATISIAALLGIPDEKLIQAVTSFKALEHRLEFAGTIDGVDFYNDSKATNPASTIKALEAFGERGVVLIAGGRDKGTSLTELVAVAHEHTTDVILLGEAKDRFRSAFAQGGVENLHCVNSLDEAVELGATLKKGPVVLSPACASFDMFKDYEERGRVFKNLVRERLEKVGRSS